MRRGFLILAVALATALPTAASAQEPDCVFILGFKALHALAPNDVGDCLDNEADTANGDAVQHTTNGLLVWRIADNWTAFTNGYRTWIQGPNGLATRRNIQRFGWEANPEGLPLVDTTPTLGPRPEVAPSVRSVNPSPAPGPHPGFTPTGSRSDGAQQQPGPGPNPRRTPVANGLPSTTAGPRPAVTPT